MDVRELKAKLKEAGVVGAGGAGFPTYAKLGEGIDTVILNCNGFNWIVYTRSNGKRGYLKIRDLATGEKYGVAR